MNHDLSEPSLAPRAFGPFRVLHQIGVGVLGPVYRAQGEAHDELVAIKAFRLDIPPEQAADVANGLIALRDEWPTRTGLAEIFAAGLEGETPWLALPHLSTPTLDTRLRETRATPAFDLKDALALIRGLAAALDAAHARGIVHGSLHPRDVFIGAGGLARVTGFGIAAVLARSGIRAPARRPYSAPETLEGAPVTPSADFFALGALAFELLTGRRPAGLGAAAAAHLELPASEEAVAHVRTIVAAMLAEQPGHRPGSAVAFAQALAQALPHVATAGAGVGFADLEASELGYAPSDDALRLFATQGTLWEASRPVEPWSEATDGREDTFASGVGADADTDDLEAVIDAARLSGPPAIGDAALHAQRHAPATDDESTPIYARAPTGSTSGSMLGLSAPTGRSPDVFQMDEPPESPDDPRYAAADEPPYGRVATLQEPSAEPSPPAVVLALTLALGLAIGGAGGFLIGQRGANRDRERAALPSVSDEARSAAETPDPSSAAAPRDEPSAIDETTPPVGSPTSTSGASGARAPARSAPSGSAQPESARPGSARPGSAQSGSAQSGRAASGPNPAAAVRRRAAIATGEIVVRSIPASAGVVLNNTWRGRTPLTLRDLAFGTHSVRVVANGYAPETRRVSLDARAPAATVAVQLTRTAPAKKPATKAPARPGVTTGSVYIESRPSGARVLIDGRLVGSSPLLISELAPGAHAIRLDHPGHRSWTTTVEITAGQRQRVAASLEETPGS